MSGALDRLNRRFDRDAAPAIDLPQRSSFHEFLVRDARVPIGEGRDAPYSFEGREALIGVVATIDKILGSRTGQPLADSTLALAGGAQFGKTILELNLGAYCTAQRFLNFGLYMPDNEIASTVIDTKFRPEVVDRIPWLAEMTQIGRAVNASGKSVNTKRAAMITDGKRRATFLVAGLQKPATTFSLDLAARDEEDDILPKYAKFVAGRLTASSYRIQFIIGTQRIHGRGMQRAWDSRSRGVVLLGPKSDRVTRGAYEASDEVEAAPERWINPEEAFPGIVRCAVAGFPQPDDPKLTWSGDFRHDHAADEIVATHNFSNLYYLAHPETGEELDRRHPLWLHRSPSSIEEREWGYRISQLSIDAISLMQVVGRMQRAVEDPEEMTVFRCDVLGLPKSLAQALTPEVIDRARAIEPYELRMVREPGRAAFAGLDTGDRCWLWIREIEAPDRKRLIYSTSFPSGDLVRRVIALSALNLWDCLLMDQRPLVGEARGIALALNGLEALEQWPTVPKKGSDSFISFPGGLTWNGKSAAWKGMKAAVVRFDKKKIGQGIDQWFDEFQEGGLTKFVPLVNCNREETIDRVVRELLTPDEGVNEIVEGRARVLPSMLLPIGEEPIHQMIRDHLVTGSERQRNDDGTMGDYVDGVSNHLLLADGYSGLAEQVGLMAGRGARPSYESVAKRSGGRLDRRGGRRAILA